MQWITLIFTLLLAQAAAAGPDWQAALQGEHRSVAHKQRDAYRHPRETLTFFGLREDMTVVELSPGSSGWYTEILAPLLKDRGTLYAAHSALNPPHPYYRKSLGKFLQKLGETPELYNPVIVTQLQPPIALEAAPAGVADMVLTFRNLHNWIKAGTAADVLAAAFVALKPGGVLGVVEHRAKAGTDREVMNASGYVTEALTIELALAAGFTLSARSEINANPRDTADHPKGVWTLPPNLRMGDEMRDHYTGIGESDRMTLKFLKPR